MIKSTSLESANQARYPPYTDSKKQLMSVLVFGLPAATGAKIKAISTVFGAAWDIFFSSGKTNQDSKL